jgi:hypothetical protein
VEIPPAETHPEPSSADPEDAEPSKPAEDASAERTKALGSDDAKSTTAAEDA